MFLFMSSVCSFYFEAIYYSFKKSLCSVLCTVCFSKFLYLVTLFWSVLMQRQSSKHLAMWHCPTVLCDAPDTLHIHCKATVGPQAETPLFHPLLGKKRFKFLPGKMGSILPSDLQLPNIFPSVISSSSSSYALAASELN